ncbi:MAG: hypothetical protein II460_01480 [Oscillospiraceae bacterium]|nr:hypothetical protein [Oscillospiraceae bacterium]
MSSSIKNYTEQGGECTVIGGKLTFEEGARVSGFPGCAVLDMQGYDLAEAISRDADITSIVSVDAFQNATAGDKYVVISNAAFGGLTGLFSMQGLEINQGRMIFGVAYLPRGADISAIFSIQMWYQPGSGEDPDAIKLSVSMNYDMNEKLGFSLD